ncbi:hypothetical protein AS156_14665 [Bradyrhizobium macuxiense]|uniref:Lectin-like protein BA14k n=1 Tax=Bradyrhizobium macuxiense TaxID=1755647 RepID=A0A109JJG0_9BRAD|nr:BA14K family protein [Bradyrhizobium macuxiense]KWV50013.1 hypothetical protein AS156_14665 [Bradyrhizobium macuxiense]
MAGHRIAAAAALLLRVTLAPAVAQMSEPAAFDAQNPGRSSINGGALTPWDESQLAAERRGDPGNAYGAMAPTSFACMRHHSFDPAPGTFHVRDGRRHACQ